MSFAGIGGGTDHVVSQGNNFYGQKRPDFISTRDYKGNLDPKYTQSLGSAGQNLLNQGLSKGDSPWASAQRQMIEQQRLQGMGNAAQQNAAQQAQARSTMGMRGGFGSGASERLSQAGARNLMNANQGFGRQAAAGNLGVSAQDQGMKNQILGNMMGQQQAIQKGNIGTATKDINLRNLLGQQNYKADMAALGANKQADATIQANQGSDFSILNPFSWF